MALVEIFHVVAANHDIGSTAIDEGQLVKLDATGAAVPFDGSGVIIGVAGDTKSTVDSAMPGVAAGWQNRASDYFNETGASRKLTVYMAGGQFATDKFAAAVEAATPGTKLYGDANGLLNTAVLGDAVAVLTKAAGAYPSGVPGTDINGDIALSGDNTNQYIEFKLLV